MYNQIFYLNLCLNFLKICFLRFYIDICHGSCRLSLTCIAFLLWLIAWDTNAKSIIWIASGWKYRLGECIRVCVNVISIECGSQGKLEGIDCIVRKRKLFNVS